MCSAPVVATALREARSSRGWMTTSTSASAISTGTMASNALAGEGQQQRGAGERPGDRVQAQVQDPAALALELAAIADHAGDGARHQPEVVGDVRHQRRVVERD